MKIVEKFTLSRDCMMKNKSEKVSCFGDTEKLKFFCMRFGPCREKVEVTFFEEDFGVERCNNTEVGYIGKEGFKKCERKKLGKICTFDCKNSLSRNWRIKVKKEQWRYDDLEKNQDMMPSCEMKMRSLTWSLIILMVGIITYIKKIRKRNRFRRLSEDTESGYESVNKEGRQKN